MLRFTTEDVVWQEVPDEVSLAYLISGCPLRCHGCHSHESWHAQAGEILTLNHFKHKLAQYQGLISCVLFLGGEWQADLLLPFLTTAREKRLQTCLYTGLERAELDEQAPQLIPHLTYLKTGRWCPELGGLESPTTNQQFIDLRTNTNLTHRFATREAL